MTQHLQNTPAHAPTNKPLPAWRHCSNSPWARAASCATGKSHNPAKGNLTKLSSLSLHIPASSPSCGAGSVFSPVILSRLSPVAERRPAALQNTRLRPAIPIPGTT